VEREESGDGEYNERRCLDTSKRRERRLALAEKLVRDLLVFVRGENIEV